jgi:hypothetical protein
MTTTLEAFRYGTVSYRKCFTQNLRRDLGLRTEAEGMTEGKAERAGRSVA